MSLEAIAVTTTESWIQVLQGPKIQIRILLGLTCLQGMIDVRCIGEARYPPGMFSPPLTDA